MAHTIFNKETLMDYQFTRNDKAEPVAIFAMGAESLGHWFTEELGTDQQKIIDLLKTIEQLEHRQISEFQLTGKEFNLELTIDEVEVYASIMRNQMDEDLPEDTNLYDQESITGCGLEDFKIALLSWTKFIGG
ncbi:MAG: hypothetical protein ACJA13_000853 [Paraglaciecola sp.]|jgi:uncharacterized protein YacL (UPF0231 family)